MKDRDLVKNKNLQLSTYFSFFSNSDIDIAILKIVK